jgi:TolB-like protein
VLKGAVLAFEEVDKEDGWYGRVKIVMELTDASSGKTLWSDVLERDKKAASKTPSAVVEALSLALDEVVGSAGSEIKAAVGRSVG